MPKEPVLVRVSGVSPSEILTVSALNRSVRDLIEHRYPLLWVGGEISNFMSARSGHLYFSLKDETAQVRCVMFRNRNQYLDWAPRDGMKVEVQALVTLYEARGDFQLNVESMRRAGVGALFEAFVRLRDRLQQEGLFDVAAKRPIPEFPRRIGIVTSTDAAALRDVISTLARRNPSIEVVVFPAPVQGEGAAQKLALAIRGAAARGDCDVLILARGGGSLEDLWAFNDEHLARVIRACPIPVVTGIGHETDFTIADFAADVRAPTPTAAAELVSPLRRVLLERVGAGLDRLRKALSRDLERRMQLLDGVQRRLIHPGRRLSERRAALLQLRLRLKQAMERQFDDLKWRLRSATSRAIARSPQFGDRQRLVGICLERIVGSQTLRLSGESARVGALQASLHHLAPMRVLERGYSVARDARGRVIRASVDIAVGQELDISFARGSAKTRVESKD
jgi:exodeoxyribonuclease VII large subunit